MIGIYKIVNMINGHTYIGQSVDIQRRWRNERSRAFQPNSNEYNSLLAQAFRKYGVDNFQFAVIEQCEVQQLDEREQYWIRYYNTYQNGYNQTLGGQQQLTLKEPDVIANIRTALLTTELPMTTIANHYGVSLGTVGGINTGKTWYSNQYDYPLRNVHQKTPATRQYAVNLSKDALTQLIREHHGNLSAVAKTLGVTRGALRRPIREYQLESCIEESRHPTVSVVDETVVDDVGNIFDSPAAANHYYGCAHVREVCNGKRKTSGGHVFYWKRDQK